MNSRAVNRQSAQRSTVEPFFRTSQTNQLMNSASSHRSSQRSNTIPFPQHQANGSSPAGHQSDERIVPQSLEAEMSSLGAMIIDRDAIARAVNLLAVDDFYRPPHKTIFSVIVEMYLDEKPVDLETLFLELKKRKLHDETGGAAYLSICIESCPSSANIDSYARVIVEKSVKRLELRAADILRAGAYGESQVEDTASVVIELLQSARQRLCAGSAPLTITAPTLLAMEIPPPGWAVPGFIPQGLSIFGGMEKAGKSWLTYALAVAVASGSEFLGHSPAAPGPVLYLALEDSTFRLQDRLKKILGSTQPPPDLHIQNTWPTADKGGLAQLERWLDLNTTARLIVIDVLQKFRPPREKGGDVYGEDYDAMGALKNLADDRNIAILVNHHLSKRENDDPFRRLSGSVGIGGAADGMLVLDRKRNKDDAVLHLTGRDVPTERYALLWEIHNWAWRLIGDAEVVTEASTRDQILQLLSERDDWFSPRDIQDELQLTPSNARTTLRRMANEGVLRVQNHTYRRALDYSTGIEGNKCNATTGAALSAPED